MHSNGVACYLSSGESGSGQADLLTSISNGLGGTTTVEYTPSSAWSNTYLPVGMILQTVSSVTTSDGRGNTSTTNYSYEGGLWSNKERSFLGFRKVTAVLDAEGNYTETFYLQREGSISKPEFTYFKDPSGSIYRYSQFDYDYNLEAPYTSLLTNRWEYECNLSSNCFKTLSQFAYDNYGNVETTYEYGDYDVAGDERTTVRTVIPNTTDYIVSLPASEEVFEGIGVDPLNLKKQVRFYYDNNTSHITAPVKGDVTKLEKWNDQTGGYVAASMTYDTYGNVTTKTDERGTTTVTEYETAYNIYPTATYVEVNPAAGCSAVNHCMTTVWDTVLGLKLSTTDANNATSSNTYDAMGRVLNQTNPAGTTVVQYLDWGNPTLQRIRKSEPDGTADGLWTEAYQDGLGRAYKQVREGGFTQETEFDDVTKRPFRQSLWYAAGENPRYITYQYDGLGRKRIITNPDATYAEVVYANDANGKPYKAAYDELRHETVMWQDAYGNVTQVREYIDATYAYTTYEYDVLGNPVRVVDAHGNETTTLWDSLGRKLTTNDVDMGTWNYLYDATGNLLTQTDAKNQQTEFSYDALGRVTAKTVQGVIAAEYFYDEAGHGASQGRLTRIITPDGSESHTWNNLGLETEVTRCVDSDCMTIGQGYDSLGRVTSITYPDNEVVTYGYDDSGQLAAVPGYADSLNWTSNGQLAAMNYSNGTSNTFTFDADRQWLTTSTVTGPGTTTLYEAGYTYYATALISDIVSSTNAQLNMHLGYDSINRLTTVTGGQSQSFTYDALGNMTNNSALGTYGYNDPNHKHAVTSAGAMTMAYDGNGNMTTDGFRTFSWDGENRLKSVTRDGLTTSFKYDQDGNRIEKAGATGSIIRYFGSMVELNNGELVKHYYAGSMLIAKQDTSGTYWYHGDHLQSTRLMTDSLGQAVKTYDYAVFGDIINETGTLHNERTYTGHNVDPDTGLIYMNARYYDATLGRFLSADTIVQDPFDPQFLNRYTYCRNNPVMYTDPSGHCCGIEVIIAGAVIGALIGGTTAELMGGDFFEGALTGAISGALFAGVGNMIAMAEQAGRAFTTLQQVGLHAGAGALSGGINSFITDSDLGIAMLTGAIAGGVGMYAGPYLEAFGKPIEYAGRSLMGGFIGGLGAELYGGEFGRGFAQGALTAAYGAIANDGLHKGAKFIFRKNDALPDQYTNADVVNDALNMVVNSPDGPVKIYDGMSYRVINKNGNRLSYSDEQMQLSGVYSIGNGGTVTINKIEGRLPMMIPIPRTVTLSASQTGIVNVHLDYPWYKPVPIPRSYSYE